MSIASQTRTVGVSISIGYVGKRKRRWNRIHFFGDCFNEALQKVKAFLAKEGGKAAWIKQSGCEFDTIDGKRMFFLPMFNPEQSLDLSVLN